MKIWLTLGLLFITAIGFTTPPPATDVFQVTVNRIDPNLFTIAIDIKPHFFLYKDRLHITHNDSDLLRLGTVTLPKGLMKKIPEHASRLIYRNSVLLSVPVLGQYPGETYLDLHYQGCSDSGFCYPKEVAHIRITIDAARALHSVILESVGLDTQTSTPPLALSHMDWIFSLLSFFGTGLLLSFTPCVLPMIPVLSGIIVHAQTNTRKSFYLSLSYVLGMSLAYAISGAIVALLGTYVQALLQSPWVVVTFSIFFVLLALSMFGFYELRLPMLSSQKWSKMATGHYIGSALMGAASILILSPCITPPLIGILGYIAETGNIWFGSISLFCLGLGMGLPLLVIGTSAGHWLPKAGPWMERIKIIFGVFLLAIAAFLLNRVIPFKDLLPSYFQTTSKATTVSTVKAFNTFIMQHRNEVILLDFYADWCTSCQILEKTIFENPKVLPSLQSIHILRVDVSQYDKDEREIMENFHVFAPPTFILILPSGKPYAKTLVGDISPDAFVSWIHSISRVSGSP